MHIRQHGYDPALTALRETLFHTANGYIGVRASPEEGAQSGARSVRGAYINAFYDTGEIAYGEKLHGFATQRQTMLNVVDVQGVFITLAGERFDPASGHCDEYEMTLDMDAGVSTRRVVWTSPQGRKTRLLFERMASFDQRELFLLRVTITPVGWSGEISILSTQNGDVSNDFDPADPRKLAEGGRMLVCEKAWARGDMLLMACRAARSGMTMASAVAHEAPDGFSASIMTESARNAALFTGFAADGRAIRLIKRCVFTDSRRHGDPPGDAARILAQCRAEGFDGWAVKQRRYLDKFWADAAIEVRGDDALNDSLHFCAYSLLQSCGGDGISNISSKGLSGEGYEGHYFWDTEIYMLPFFLLTSPDRARALLDYRYTILPSAREQARLLGHRRGALYAWRTIGGAECSGYYPSGSAQYHINADVAHAFLDYWRATGDIGYMAEKGAAVLIETARLWLDAGHYGRDGRFHIHCVTGPDEYTCLVNDNFYTNRAARHHLRGVAALCDALDKAGRMAEVVQKTGVTPQELAEFTKAAGRMALYYDETLGIAAQDDAFLSRQTVDIAALPKADFPLLTHYHPLWLYRRQVCKQADAVLAHFLYEEDEPEDVIRRTYEYYEKITTHDSSLSECVFSMMAARIGDVDKALDYYGRSACLDLQDTHGNTGDGIHAANMGGAWMGIVFGFGGLRLTEGGLSLRPCLPGAWRGYAFAVQYRGSRIRVDVDAAGVTIQLISGQPLDLAIYGKQARLRDCLRVSLRRI